MLMKAFYRFYLNPNLENCAIFVDEELSKHEAIAEFPRKTGHIYLFETDDITLLDIHIAPYWELLLKFKESRDQTIWNHLNLKQNAPCLLGYVKHFKETDFPQQAHIWVMANEQTLIDIYSHHEISHKY